MKYTLAFILVATVLLSGCNEEEKALLAKPSISEIGEFDGCNVKFVNRGYEKLSFYIAKCDTTSTSTTNYTTSSGKSTTFRRKTIITKEIEKLQAEKADLDAKAAAMEKLTPTERKALGIKD